MDEFLGNNYYLITHSVEIIAAITGLFCLRKYKGTAAIYFIYFLVFIALADLFGEYSHFVYEGGLFDFLKGTTIEENNWWYTLFWDIGSILFFTFYFQKILFKENYILTVKIARNIFLYFSLIYIIFNWEVFFYRSFPILYIAGAIIIFLCIIKFIERKHSQLL